MIFRSCLFIFVVLIHLTQLKGTGCDFQQRFEDAFENSEAVFLGSAVEEKTIPMSSKGGNNLTYKEVKFEVEKSWKLIDKKFVWLRIPATRSDDCGYVGIGVRYLIYANQINDNLFISPSSRTMKIEDASGDFDKLGDLTIELSYGGFRSLNSQILIASVICLLIGIFAFYIYRVSKRSVSRF